jgi:hypothetical protein
MSVDTQLGFKDEVTWGTAVTVDRFSPLLSEKIAPQVARLHSEARRAGELVMRNDGIPIVKGYSGPVEIPIYSKDFGFWLKHLCGTVATAGPTDSAYTHTGTIGTLLADSFTAQVNRPFHDAGTNQAFTYEGGKITSWELTAAVDEEAKLAMECDFEDCSTATALATASYTASMELLNWAHAESNLTIGGSAYPVTKFSLKVDSKLKTDRHYIRGSALKKQQVQAGFREITWELEGDFDALTHYNRVIAATSAAAHAAIVVTLKANTLIGVSSEAALVITIPAARFDEIDLENGMDPNMQTLSGTAWYDASASAVSLAYTTSQSTP